MDNKEKIEEAKRLYETANADQKYVLESLFPEIRESDDERIRKEIINYFKCQSIEEPSRKDTHNKWIAWLEKVIIPNHNDIDSSFIEDIKNVISEAPLLMQSDKKKMIDWLEKQGHTDCIIERAKNEKQRVIITETDGNANIDWDARSLKDARKLLERGLQYINTELEKQGNDKPIKVMKSPEESLGISSKEYNDIVNECLYGEKKPADRVEPKFQNGQWIVWQDKCYKVNYNGCGYELTDRNGFSTSLEYGTIDENAHLWDITKDAKDGDVLVNDEGKPFIFKGLLDAEHPNCPVAYGGVCINCYDVEEFCISERYRWWCDLIGVKPATKEQRDALMKAMADAGYEWDAERKELKKVENKNYLLSDFFKAEYERGKADVLKSIAWSEEDDIIISKINSVLNAQECYDGATGIKMNPYKDALDWLKSIKQRCVWKENE